MWSPSSSSEKARNDLQWLRLGEVVEGNNKMDEIDIEIARRIGPHIGKMLIKIEPYAGGKYGPPIIGFFSLPEMNQIISDLEVLHLS
jgi:hypothetical protein